MRAAADAAVRELGWTRPYHVDADHIRLETVDRFLTPSDFTIDVADFIGKPPEPSAVQAFVERHPELLRKTSIAGVEEPFATTTRATRTDRGQISVGCPGSRPHLPASIRTRPTSSSPKFRWTKPTVPKLHRNCSSSSPPSPTKKFPSRPSRRNLPDAQQGRRLRRRHRPVRKEFNDDLAVLAHATKQVRCRQTSSSASIRAATSFRSTLPSAARSSASTRACTSRLPARRGSRNSSASPRPAAMARTQGCLSRRLRSRRRTLRALCRRDRDQCEKLPTPEEVRRWSSLEYVAALRHDPKSPHFNPRIRQLLHVGYKVAAKMGDRYLKLLGQ